MTKRFLIDNGHKEVETTVETFCRNYPEAYAVLEEIEDALEEDGEYYLETAFGTVAIYPA